MSGAIKTDSALITEMPVNGAGQIVPQFIWDTVVSKLSVNPATVAAAGTNQGNATALTVQFNIITSGSGGVIVAPSAVQSNSFPYFLKIWNATAVTINVYPPSGVQFDTSGTNIPVQLGPNAAMEVCITSSIQGYAR